MSLQSLIKSNGALLPLRQLAYALDGKHRLSPTTRATVVRAVGPWGAAVEQALDGKGVPAALEETSDWAIVLSALRPTSNGDFVYSAVRHMAALDDLYFRVQRLSKDGRQEEAAMHFAAALGDFLPHWRASCPAESLPAALRIDTSLRVLALLESDLSVSAVDGDAGASVVLALLRPGAKPVGHWLKQLQAAVRRKDIKDNKGLAKLLYLKAVQHRGKPISHDTLKGWSSMKPGMLITLQACDSLLSVLNDKSTADLLRARFALARFLAFLCDLLRSSVAANALTWVEAQGMVAARYDALLEHVLSTQAGNR